MKEKSAPQTRLIENAVHLYLAREQGEALKSYLDRGRKLGQLSEQALAEKHFEVIKAWAKHLQGSSDVTDVYAEYELRGLEPPPLDTVPGWQVITAAASGAANNMSQELKDEIGRDVLSAYRSVKKERH